MDPQDLDFWHQAFLVGKDFGAMPAYLVATVHPERVSGIITLGIPFILPGPSAVQNHLLPEGFYISRWQVCIHSYINIVLTEKNI
jgi:pimeloyl-ACP methyl ester carboxylesterase